MGEETLSKDLVYWLPAGRKVFFIGMEEKPPFMGKLLHAGLTGSHYLIPHGIRMCMGIPTL